MRDYLLTLDHCPFCKNNLIENKGQKDNKHYYGRRWDCPDKHNYYNLKTAVWCWKNFKGTRISTVNIRVHNLDDSRSYTHISFFLKKNLAKDSVKIFCHKHDDNFSHYSNDLKFKKLVPFDFDDEEKFKNKLNTILVFS